MTISEHFDCLLKQTAKLPNSFVHDYKYDTVLLIDMFELVPEVVRARTGRTYIYFENMNPEKLMMVRQMGFEPHLHKSHKYFPPKYIYRARIYQNMSRNALNIANKISSTTMKEIDECKINQQYMQYMKH